MQERDKTNKAKLEELNNILEPLEREFKKLEKENGELKSAIGQNWIIESNTTKVREHYFRNYSYKNLLF